MNALDRVRSVAAAGTTFAANFWPWLLAAFLAGAGLAGWGGFKLAKLIYQGEALESQKNLAEFKGALSYSHAQGEAEAARRQTEALAAINARDAHVNNQVAQIPARVAALLAPKFNALEGHLNDPRFDCLRDPLPPPALRLLERPGGRASEDRGGADGGASPGSLPDAASSRAP